MHLRDLFESPISPTDSFTCLHGNYCGPGNRGGAPIDALDRACFKHDCEYDKSYGESADQKQRRQLVADIHFVKRAMKVANDKSISIKVRFKAFVAARYFMIRIARCPLVPLPSVA